jgi:hypothetical protein
MRVGGRWWGGVPVDVVGVVPISRRAAAFEVVLADPHPSQLDDELADPADLGDQHRHGVLALDRVIEHRRVQHPPVLRRDHAGGIDHRPHRVEDPLRVNRRSQLVAPQGQHRRMERFVGQRETRGGLPGDVALERTACLTVRLALERLEDHDRCDHIGRHRRAPAARAEQVSEHLVREQRAPVLGQQRVHGALPEQMAAQRRRVEQLTIRARRTLHPAMLFDPPTDRESSSPQPRLLSSLLAVQSEPSPVGAGETCEPFVSGGDFDVEE